LRRIAQIIPTLIVVCVAVFALIRLVPGDPARAMLGEAATSEQVAAMRHTLGLDLPLPCNLRIGWPQRFEAISDNRSSTSFPCCRWCSIAPPSADSLFFSQS
jgi:Binding-prot-dependent transport system membrane comp, N-term